MAPKKKEMQKMSLGEFMADKDMGSWADEMEDMPVYSRTGYGTERRTYSATTGTYGSGNTGGYSVRDEPTLPDKPPFTVHLGNLSFDATNGDVSDFFARCDCTNVRIIEDRVDMKPKGFGYAEFATRDGLKQALTLNGSQFQGRSVRISIADPPKDRGDRPEARDISDWSRKGPLPDLPARSGIAGNRRDDARGFGSDNGNDRKDRYTENDGKTRDLGNWERKGPLPSILPSERTNKEGSRLRTNDASRLDIAFRDRKPSPASWGEGRQQTPQEAPRPPRREFQERPAAERPLTAAEQDNQWRRKMRPDAPTVNSPAPSRDGSEGPSSPGRGAAVPQSRPKLNLTKRTVSEVHDNSNILTPGDAKASPFGAAKPIDTAAKEREIEEKRLALLKEKKEAEDKVIEARKEAATKAALEVEGHKKMEILQRTQGSSSLKKDEDSINDQLNGDNDNNKVSKIRDVTSEARSNPSEAGEWRRASSGPLALRDDIPKGPRAGNGGTVRGRNDGRDQRYNEDHQTRPNMNGASTAPNTTSNIPSEPDAKALKEDGWSTVSKHRKNNRGGNKSARAIAS
ncbi:translation initiation factor 4B [Golovinomyces cichoracearum]|uniref:Translation initiation factor 4B n=1 Tax=Golovinomyces cichoracearum TaxID=62708 RepID=A0A420I270_9PEZI|nr:translation initiation factor 4B [Golovinomyces cichoracearum]